MLASSCLQIPDKCQETQRARADEFQLAGFSALSLLKLIINVGVWAPLNWSNWYWECLAGKKSIETLCLSNRRLQLGYQVANTASTFDGISSKHFNLKKYILKKKVNVIKYIYYHGQVYGYVPVYSGKQMDSGDLLILFSKMSFLFRKRMMEVSLNHLLLQMESNSFRDSCMRFCRRDVSKG